MMKCRLLVILWIFFVNDALSLKESFFKLANEKIPKLDKEYFNKYQSKNWSSIKKVEIISSEIAYIHPDTFKEFYNLKWLNLFNNRIKEITFKIPTLEYLSLTDNKLEEGINLENFPVLNTLILRNNRIVGYSHRSNNSYLKKLELSFNPLKDVEIEDDNLEEIIILGIEYKNISFNIICKNLQVFDTNHISKEALKNVLCTSDINPIIYTLFNGYNDKFRCRTNSTTSNEITTEPYYSSMLSSEVSENNRQIIINAEDNGTTTIKYIPMGEISQYESTTKNIDDINNSAPPEIQESTTTTFNPSTKSKAPSTNKNYEGGKSQNESEVENKNERATNKDLNVESGCTCNCNIGYTKAVLVLEIVIALLVVFLIVMLWKKDQRNGQRRKQSFELDHLQQNENI